MNLPRGDDAFKYHRFDDDEFNSFNHEANSIKIPKAKSNCVGDILLMNESYCM